MCDIGHFATYRLGYGMESLSISNSRPFNGCTGRLFLPSAASKAVSPASETSMGVSKTNHWTPSEHGGVVSDPS